MINLIDKDGQIWNFYVDNQNNLCYSFNNSSSVLLNNCTNEFDCSISLNGEIHIVIQTAYGEIIYIKFNGEIWQKYVILQNKFKRQSIYNISLFLIDGIPTVFYCIYHNHRYYIVYQTSNIDGSTNPKVIDYSFDGDFSVSYDNKKYIHITYKNEDEIPVYKTVNLQYGKEKRIFLNLPLNVKKITSLYYNDCLNVVYILRFNNHYTVNYKNLSTDFEHILGFGNDSLCIPTIFPSGDKLNVLWTERFSSYLVTSENNGKTFSKIDFLGNKTLIKCKKCGYLYAEYIIKSTY